MFFKNLKDEARRLVGLDEVDMIAAELENLVFLDVASGITVEDNQGVSRTFFSTRSSGAQGRYRNSTVYMVAVPSRRPTLGGVTQAVCVLCVCVCTPALRVRKATTCQKLTVRLLRLHDPEGFKRGGSAHSPWMRRPVISIDCCAGLHRRLRMSTMYVFQQTEY